MVSDRKDWFKIGELAAMTGVTRQSIHFYLKEGLLLPPVSSSRNMAYYGQEHVDDIRFIKELQEKQYLPLSVIKKVLEARRSGHDIGDDRHLEAFTKWFQDEAYSQDHLRLTHSELLARSGIGPELLASILSLGLIEGDQGHLQQPYSGSDAILARLIGQLVSMGMSVDSLALYSEYLTLMRREMNAVHNQVIHRPGSDTHPDLTELSEVLGRIRSLLSSRVLKELLQRHPHSEIYDPGDD